MRPLLAPTARSRGFPRRIVSPFLIVLMAFGSLFAAPPLVAEAAAPVVIPLTFTSASQVYTFTVTTSGDGDLTVDTIDCCIAGDMWGVKIDEVGPGPQPQACGDGNIITFSGAATVTSFSSGFVDVFYCSGVDVFPAGMFVRFQYTGTSMIVTPGGPVPSTLTLSPKADVNPVGTQHCVTATVRDQLGNPMPGIRVRFTVTGSVNTSGSATTNSIGQATFCYQGPSLPGADVIRAFADTDSDGTQDPGEPSDVAGKKWVLPVSTPGCEIKITNGGWIIAQNGDRGSFGGNAKVDADGNVSGNEEYQDHGPAQPMNLHGGILAVICGSDGKSGTVFGTATIDGAGSHFYRIDVVDNGEGSGSMPDTYWIQADNGYDSANKPLKGGNVQVRRES
jgi:hypothetical protein